MTVQFKKGLQITALVVTIVGTVSAGWWAIDSTYAREKQTIETFSQMQQQIKEFKQESIIDRLRTTILSLTEHKYIIKDQTRKYPNDQDLKEEYKNIVEDLEKAEKKLEVLEAQ